MSSSLFNVFDTAGTAMNAQSVRLNTTASNLSNAETVSGSEAAAYRSRHPVFETIQNELDQAQAGVNVSAIVESTDPIQKQYQPGHPMADEKGYIYRSNVNVIDAMTEMLSASKSYQFDVQMLDTAKTLLLKTLQLGQ
jgi:flagellar basal-body rod protein FlgC